MVLGHQVGLVIVESTPVGMQTRTTGIGCLATLAFPVILLYVILLMRLPRIVQPVQHSDLAPQHWVQTGCMSSILVSATSFAFGLRGHVRTRHLLCVCKCCQTKLKCQDGTQAAHATRSTDSICFQTGAAPTLIRMADILARY